MLPWISNSQSQLGRAEADYDDRHARAAAWDALNPEQRRDGGETNTISPDPRHEIQIAGGLADEWYIDDGDILCDPCLVGPFLERFDIANRMIDDQVPVHAERNVAKNRSHVLR